MDVKFRIISYYGRSNDLQWKGTNNIQIYFIQNLLIYTLLYFFKHYVRFK